MPKKTIVRRAKFMEPRKKTGLEIVGGARPTGKLPKVIGSGIFGYPGEAEGIFSISGRPLMKSGIFFNPYAMTNLELEQPSDAWVLERRPGQPLYPGAVGRGIVLIGPSMGNDTGQPQETSTACTICFGLFIGFLAFLGVESYKKRPETYKALAKKAVAQARKIDRKSLIKARTSIEQSIVDLRNRFRRGEVSAREYEEVSDELRALKAEINRRAAVAARR